MVSLAESLPGTRIRIFSGLEPGNVERALLLATGADKGHNDGGEEAGTTIAGGGHGLGTVISASRR